MKKMLLVVLVALCSLSFGADVADCYDDCIKDYISQLNKQEGDIRDVAMDTPQKCIDYCNPKKHSDPTGYQIPKQGNYIDQLRKTSKISQ